MRAGDGEVLEGVQVGPGPRTRDGVDRADRPDGPSGVVAQRPARVGDHAEVGDRQVVPEPVVDAGVVDHQRLVVADDVLAERVRQRGLPRLHVLLGQAHGAREDLAIVLHDGDQGDRDGEGPADHPGVPVEAGGDHVGGRWLRVRHRVRRRFGSAVEPADQGPQRALQPVHLSLGEPGGLGDGALDVVEPGGDPLAGGGQRDLDGAPVGGPRRAADQAGRLQAVQQRGQRAVVEAQRGGEVARRCRTRPGPARRA